MPDMSYHTARWCESNEHASAVVNGYTLTYSRANPGPYAINWSCNCQGFRFRRTCKHIVQAEQQRCGYGHEAAAGSPVDMGKHCPKCGCETTVVAFEA